MLELANFVDARPVGYHNPSQNREAKFRRKADQSGKHMLERHGVGSLESTMVIVVVVAVVVV